jgi:hypothetical protein
MSKSPKQPAKTVAIDPRLQDFRNFLYVVWKHLNLPQPTDIQYDIAEFIQNAPKRSIIEAFRGVGKSYITSAHVCHQLLLNPDKKFLVVSASKSRADDFSTFTLRLINELPILQHLRPSEDQRSSKIGFDVGPTGASHSPSVKSVGITGMITGSRADEIIADDVESANNSMTQGMRDRVAESVKEFEAVLKPDGKILFLGTPQCEESLYNKLQERGYVCRIWPARYPEPNKMVSYGDKLAPRICDLLEKDPNISLKTTDPKRFSDLDLMEREASYGKSGFQLQFMLDTSLSDMERYPLRLSDLCVMSLNHELSPQKIAWAGSPDYVIDDLPCVGMSGDRYYSPMFVSKEDWLPYEGSIMAIDPSGRGRDETSYAVLKYLHGMLFLTESGGFNSGYTDDTLNALATVAKRQKVTQIIVEENYGGGMFTQLLKPVLGKVYPCSVEEVKHSKQKELRIIDTLEPILNQHRLIVDKRVIERDYRDNQHLPPEMALRYQLFYQLSRITKDRGALAQDDRLDALAIGVAFWTERMAQDIDRAVEDAKEAKFDEELRKFHENVFGHKPKEKTWISSTVNIL